MAEKKNVKLKILYLLRLLQDETDEDHGLTMEEILTKLNEEYGIETERKSIYRDLDTLREADYAIKMYHRAPAQYSLVNREFSLSQLMFIVDAVQSSKALTERQCTNLIRQIKRLASDAQRKKLDRQIHVPDRIKSKSEGVFEKIDIIHEANLLHRRINFTYYRRNINGKLYVARNIKERQVTPVKIIYSEGFYYLSAYSPQEHIIKQFRLDRMGNISIAHETADRNETISAYKAKVDPYVYFGRFEGKPATALLECASPDDAEIIMDRFGGAAEFENAGKPSNAPIRAHAKVHVSPQFFGWIAGLNNKVRICGPADLLQEYQAYLRKLLES